MSFTLVLIIVISAVSLAVFSMPALYEGMVFDTARIRNDHQYYRLISPVFIHANLWHLFFNMYALYSFGRHLESAWSSLLILASFLASALAGNCYSYLRHRGEPSYRALGASGGVCGIVYSSIFLMGGGSIYLMFIPVAIPDRVFAVGFVLVSWYLMRRNEGRIGHDAHLAGALTGILVALAVFPRAVLSRWPTLALITLPLAVLPVLGRIFHRR